jgi:hypothetical protein
MAGDPEAGMELAEEALQLARSAGAPITLVYCLVAAAGALADRDPQRARGLLEEGLALRQNRDIESVIEVTHGTLIAASMRDWPLALQLADRSIRHLKWGGERAWLAGILNVVARGVVQTDIEAAARLQGAARRITVQVAAARPGDVVDAGVMTPHGPSAEFSMITDLRRQTSALLHEALDQERLRQLRADGEAMDSDQAATYALEAIRQARRSQHSHDM